jgi:hypothetical protein
VWFLLRAGYSTRVRVAGFCWTLLTLLAILAIYRTTVEADEIATPLRTEAEHQIVPLEENAIKVTALELANAFSGDEAAAKRRFDFGELEITGTVEDISLDSFGNPSLQFQGPDEFHQPQASFSGDYRGKIETKAKGDIVTIRCSTVISTAGVPRLSGCRL